jgi:hypothetical protein
VGRASSRPMLGRPVVPAVLGSDVDSLYGSDRSRSFGMLDAGSSRVAFSHAFLSSLYLIRGYRRYAGRRSDIGSPRVLPASREASGRSCSLLPALPHSLPRHAHSGDARSAVIGHSLLLRSLSPFSVDLLSEHPAYADELICIVFLAGGGHG